MAALITTDFNIPADVATGIFEKAQKGSTLAQLSGATPYFSYINGSKRIR